MQHFSGKTEKIIEIFKIFLKHSISLITATKVLLNFNRLSENDKDVINLLNNDEYLIIKSVMNDISSSDIIDCVKYNYSSFFDDKRRSFLGKYYTPKQLVELIYSMIKDKLSSDYYIMDLCCGCGAFLNEFIGYHTIGTDLDSDAILFLKELNYKNVSIDNSLLNVTREKYGLNNDTKICIVGNPPYNDKTSKNKKFGNNAKLNIDIKMDDDVKSKDIGRSFLKAYSLLNPEYICVLHPLSYLIKNANFKSLGDFTSKYKLIDGVIFSSSLFYDLGNTEFPVLAGLYERGNMDYDYIKDFTFKIYQSNNTFTLNRFTTIDELENANCIFGNNKKCGNKFKYPRKLDDKTVLQSDIGLYQFGIRDTNSLIANGNIMEFSDNKKPSYCTIMFDELPYFSYIHNYRKYIKNNYLIGNLSPLVNFDDIKNEEFQDLMVIGTILNDMHRIPILDIDSKNSILYTHHLWEKYKEKAKTYNAHINKFPNFYQMFIDMKNVDEEVRKKKRKQIEGIISTYFISLKQGFFS